MTQGALSLELPQPSLPESFAGLTPRPYQEEGIQAFIDASGIGCRRQLICLPTGAGKTIVFAELARRLGGRTLVLAHRDELISQAVDKFRMVWPSADVGVVKAERNESKAHVVVASVQTLARQSRLNKVDADFDLVIVDEAHHARAESYISILNHMGCGPKQAQLNGLLGIWGHAPISGPLLLGVTATPDRTDKKGLNLLFDRITYTRDIRWGIESGYLCDVQAKEVLLQLNLDDVKTRGGDFQDGELGQAMELANAPEHAFAAWKEHAEDRKTLIFAPTVSMAQHMSDHWNSNGVASACVSATTPTDERHRIFNDFSTGKIKVLSNVLVASEGYDEPSIEAIVMARPTQSRSLFVQMAGRGLRKFPGKTDLMLIDVVGASRRHPLAKMASLLGLPADALDKGATAKKAFDIQRTNSAGLSTPKPSGLPGQLVQTDVDLWAVFDKGDYAWVPTQRGTYALSLGQAIMSLEKVNNGAGWGVVIRRRDEPSTILANTKEGLPIEVAQGIAEDHLRTAFKESVHLSDKAAPWRQKSITPKQKEALQKCRIAFTDDMTAGEASDLLSSKIAGSRRKAKV